MLCERAVSHPKPLYFQEEFLEKHLSIYMEEKNISSINEIVPDEFSSWVFPHLLEHRKPLYESLANQHGYTVDLHQVQQVRDEIDFIDLICQSINRS